MPDRLALTPAEAARALGVPLRTVQEWLQHGTIPGTKVGRRWLLPPPEELAAWLRERRRRREVSAPSPAAVAPAAPRPRPSGGLTDEERAFFWRTEDDAPSADRGRVGTKEKARRG